MFLESDIGFHATLSVRISIFYLKLWKSKGWHLVQGHGIKNVESEMKREGV